MKTIKLTKKEIEFIIRAAFERNSIFQYDNYDDKEFKKWYGVSPDEMDNIIDGLVNKIQ
jgi:AraC-like DNA-binding protein